MKIPYDFKNKKVTVSGLGVSGFAAAELLGKTGARVKVVDSFDNPAIRNRAETLREKGVDCKTGADTVDCLRDSDLIVVSPGIGHNSFPPDILKKIPIIGELELGYYFCKAPIIAVTGTNGKSTTTELMGKIVEASGKHTVVCGNIGNPLCGEVYKITEHSIVVAEVSSFQLETINLFNPYIAVLLNITEDHYERHGDYENYKSAKFNLFVNQTPEDWAIINSVFLSDPAAGKIKSRVVSFGTGHKGMKIVNNRLFVDNPLNTDDVFSMDIGEIPLSGVHNIDNVISSVLAAKLTGIGNQVIKEAIRGFKSLPHRLELVDSFRGVDFIDDSKATNIDAAKRAIESMDKNVVLIAGGKDKGGDYRTIMKVIKGKVKAIVVIGEASDKIRNVFENEVPVYPACKMSDAVELGFSLANKGDAVLLSPMCSSFDMYSGYKERGDVFQREVKGLIVK